MAVTALRTSWLGYESDTGQLVFWDGEQYRPLQDAAGYSKTGHTHAIGDVSGLQTALTGKFSTAGGSISGNLSVGGTFAVSQATINDTDLLGDGTDLFAGENRKLAVIGEGHYRLKGITRTFSGSSVAIAADTRAVLIRGVGGGGGGGGAEGGTGNGAAGGGGAGGAWFEAFKTDVAGKTLSLSIGAGGTGGADTGGNGGTGGTTTIANGEDWTLSADGGTGGNGQASGDWAQATAGGFGQNATGGDLNVGGQPGQGAIRLDHQNNLAGCGGGSPFGSGGQAFAGNASGQQGLGHGAGGGGGAVADSATGQSGGAGSAGYIEIWEFT